MATFTQLASGNWRVQVRRKTHYVTETFRRRKDGGLSHWWPYLADIRTSSERRTSHLGDGRDDGFAAKEALDILPEKIR